jgi:ABC-type uncharacterized transport system permease subunit
MIILNSIIFSAPLLLASSGALISEYTGRMALFLDGIINLGAFLCFFFTIKTGSLFSGCVATIICCIVLLLPISRLVEHFKADSFLASLALNLFTNAVVSLFSSFAFRTRGVLTSPLFTFSSFSVRIWTTAAAIISSVLLIIWLKYSRQGLYLRITGSDSDVLKSRGVNASWYRTASWCIAAAYGAGAGCILSIRLSSFVPNISSGRGWIALAAVFLGKKKTAAVITAVFIFSLAEYLADNIQNRFPGIPSFFLISLPYFIALLLILVEPQKKEHSK